jgi:hypothetical protein
MLKGINIINLRKSFVISLAYVSSATLLSFDAYHQYIPSVISLILNIIFFPAIAIPNIILYSEGFCKSAYRYIFIYQSITWMIIWILLYLRFTKIKILNKNNDQ